MGDPLGATGGMLLGTLLDEPERRDLSTGLVMVSARDADVGSLLGWGFPAALGGAVSHIDTVGAARFVEECDQLARRHGERFEVPPALRELAASGGRYLED